MRVGSGKQTRLGKAFEYACVYALYSRYKDSQKVIVEDTPQLRTAKRHFEESKEEQTKFSAAASAAVRVINCLEPRLQFPNGDGPLYLGVQPDSAGEKGDVRDVLCIRKGTWEIGFSCKHNHRAVKHSRLSDTIDFGKDWFGYPCSDIYFSEVEPKFTELRQIRDESRVVGTLAMWNSMSNKAEDYYEPILRSFKDELTRLSKQHDDVPEKLIRYLIGENDFYKVIADDTHRITWVEAFNVNGTLNALSGRHRPIATIPRLKVPTRFLDIEFKRDQGKLSKNTIVVTCDNGWQISMRIHNASSKIEPSLKFDVELISRPNSLFSQDEPWH